MDIIGILTLVLTYILIGFGFAEDLPYLDGLQANGKVENERAE